MVNTSAGSYKVITSLIIYPINIKRKQCDLANMRYVTYPKMYIRFLFYYGSLFSFGNWRVCNKIWYFLLKFCEFINHSVSMIIAISNQNVQFNVTFWESISTITWQLLGENNMCVLFFFIIFVSYKCLQNRCVYRWSVIILKYNEQMWVKIWNDMGDRYIPICPKSMPS